MSEEIVEYKSAPTPKLDAIEKLYVRTYLSTLSHPEAYRAVRPGLTNYTSDNPFSRRENIKFHISLKLQERAEALSLTPDTILTQLYKEATREGAGSNHAARIQALQILGKHLGLFTEKKEDTNHIINIVNYSSTPLTIDPVDSVETIAPIESTDQLELDEEVSLINYSQEL